MLKLRGNVRMETYPGYTEIIIRAERGQNIEIERMLSIINPISSDEEYHVQIKKRSKIKSTSSNSYFWSLCDDIADSLGLTREEVYRECIRKNGVYSDVLVRDIATEKLIKEWPENGLGWFSEEIGISEAGYREVRLYYGSSVYTAKEISRLINAAENEARELGLLVCRPGNVKVENERKKNIIPFKVG